jgi:hypothetical protein
MTPSTSASLSPQHPMPSQANGPPLLRCPTHGSSTICLKRTHKPGPNHCRIFLTCRARACPFFRWMDDGFPSCRCPSALVGGGGPMQGRPADPPPSRSAFKRSVLRISKTSHSGGKWFFSCAQGGKKRGSGGVGGSPTSDEGCGFFSWASEVQLQALGGLMTPLL